MRRLKLEDSEDTRVAVERLMNQVLVLSVKHNRLKTRVEVLEQREKDRIIHRDRLIPFLYNTQGMTMQKIADLYLLSACRVQEIIRR